MNHLRFHLFLVSLMSLVAIPVFADETTAILPEKEEDIPVEFIPTLDTTISVGLRRLNSGPKVRFGNLGGLGQPITVNPNDTTPGFQSHYYTDGVVNADSHYGAEMITPGVGIGGEYSTNDFIAVRGDGGKTITVYTRIATAVLNPDGTVFKNSDGTYVPNTVSKGSDGNTVQNIDYTFASTAKFLAYQPGQTRSWSALNKSQLKADGTVEMHADGIMTSGASLEADSSSSTGFDVNVERRLGKRGRLDWGVSAGLNFAYINAKASGVFPAFLLRTTDTYRMVDTGFNHNAIINRTVDPAQPNGITGQTDLAVKLYSDPSAPVWRYVDATTAPVNVTSGADLSTATPLAYGYTPGQATIAGVVMIHGNYQLKGSYMLSHVGPSFRYNFNDRWAVSGTVGLALGWIGTNFYSTEYYNTWNDVPVALRPDEEGNTTEYHWNESNSTHKFRLGLYYDINLEYWVTDRTGFYAGITGQSLRDFTQRRLGDRVDPRDPSKIIPGRTATIDMGQGAGWTIGIRTRF
ncbi:MAG: hypothetical protein QM715_14930 [Nibricoccus sp.]